MRDDIDNELFMDLVAGLDMDRYDWAVNSVFLELARDVCRRGSWASRPDVLGATRALLRLANQRLALEPGLRVFATALECRLPATELLSWSVSGS